MAGATAATGGAVVSGSAVGAARGTAAASRCADFFSFSSPAGAGARMFAACLGADGIACFARSAAAGCPTGLPCFADSVLADLTEHVPGLADALAAAKAAAAASAAESAR